MIGPPKGKPTTSLHSRISKITTRVVVLHDRLPSHLFYTSRVISQSQTRVKLNRVFFRYVAHDFYAGPDYILSETCTHTHTHSVYVYICFTHQCLVSEPWRGKSPTLSPPWLRIALLHNRGVSRNLLMSQSLFFQGSIRTLLGVLLRGENYSCKQYNTIQYNTIQVNNLFYFPAVFAKSVPLAAVSLDSR